MQDIVLDTKGNKILAVTYGRLYDGLIRAKEDLHSRSIDIDIMKLVKIFPMSDEVADIFSKYDKVVFFEESYKYGSLSEKYKAICPNVISVALNGFVRHGETSLLLNECGLSAEKMSDLIEEISSK